MPRVEARGGMATGDRGVAHRAKTGGYGGVALGFTTEARAGARKASLGWLRSFVDGFELLTGGERSGVAEWQN